MRVAVLALVAACGDNLAEPDILERLNGTGISAVEVDGAAPYRYFDVYFEQPVDHDDANSPTFQQYAALIWKDSDAPLVMYTPGYSAAWQRERFEVTKILDANQLSLEYRFYGTSQPADVDWSKLTVHQNIEDEHRIVEWMKTFDYGPFVQTGASKGGEDTLEHASIYPDDFAASVAYVPPVITAWPDDRYAGEFDRIGIADCSQKLRDLQREMLMRRTAMETLANADGPYDLVGIHKAVETAIVELLFSFWMTRGEPFCAMVPATTATDKTLYAFLSFASPPSGYNDPTNAASTEQYTYQWQSQLGYPVLEHAYLDDLTMFSYEDWSAFLPATPPDYDPSVPMALADWLASDAPRHVMLLGGEWDPWGAGYPETSSAVARYTLSHGSHWSTLVGNFPLADQQAIVATLQQWLADN